MAWVRVKRKTSIDAPRLLASALRFSGINSPSGSCEQARLKRKSGGALGEPPPPSAHHSAYRARLNGGSTLSLGSLSEISPLLGISHQAETWACDETLRSGRQMPDLEVPRLASCAHCCSESSRCPQEKFDL